MQSAHQIRKLKLTAKRLLYSDLGQFVRIEYDIASGGTYNSLYEVTEGETITVGVVDDVRALKEVIDLNKMKLVKDARIETGDALWLFDTSINLTNLRNMKIFHKIIGSEVSATGTAVSNVMTITGANYTVNEHKGKWLFLSDGTFQIQSNTSNTVTVRLDGKTMSSGAMKIMPANPWFPSLDQGDIGDYLQHAFGDSMIYQSVFCKRYPQTGKPNEL